MHRLRDFGRELHNTRIVRIGGTTVRVLSLERIIVIKKAANREKDRLILPVLEDALATLKTTRRK